MGEPESVELSVDRFIQKLDDLEETIKNDLKESVDNIKETCEENREKIEKMSSRSQQRWEKIQHHESILEDIDEETIDTLKLLAEAFQSLSESVITWLKRIFWFLVFGFIVTYAFPNLSEKVPIDSILKLVGLVM